MGANVRTAVGSALALPFEESTFDCVWIANVVQYLSEAEFGRAIAEFKRVLRPGGTLAIKEFDGALVGLSPIDPLVTSRFFSMRAAKSSMDGKLGACGLALPALLRRLGLTDIKRQSWLAERWSPVPPPTRSLLETILLHWGNIPKKGDVSDSDLRIWQKIAANPSELIDDPDFCFREGFVVAVGRVSK